ncbi:amidohydrolase family protein [Nocardia cyriacigeorgica]|uniref:Amidohydrolase family protein n=1 Tax=Nocardia cyriacigeorgica TaxID=135487 RepID=A0ABX0CKL3_9NOCA|nr:amidohydrolase family protein [Nocardia cyriacigeorgica]NEW37508.1 amidohydrolase family protein [Nocardia cyriacigeorgica]NEW56694.1 amidohydrolase family protein [Nocardia cyriacigeorgica]
MNTSDTAGAGVLLRGRVIGASDAVASAVRRDIIDGVVVLDGDLISWVGPAAHYRGTAPVPPPSDSIVLPGLIDLHCHGGAGAGFPDTNISGAGRAAAHHRAHGTTGLLGSLVSAPPADLLRQAAVLADLVEQGELLGIHLEGPFLSRVRCGAQDPAAIIPGDPELFERICLAARGTVRSMTLAPETANFTGLLAAMRAHGVLPSLGHTDADAATTSARIAEAAGAPLTATHLFNGMPPLHHRAPGPVAACLAAAGRGELVVELIADGVHLAPETVAMVFDTVGPAHIALVSDAMAAAGMSDGDYRLGPLEVRVDGGVARLVTAGGSAGSIAGGTARLLDVLRHAVVGAGVPLADAVAAATSTPAAVLGLDAERGTLAPGYRADVVVTDPTLRVRRVITGGVPV